jgi:hypothetical protein
LASAFTAWAWVLWCLRDGQGERDACADEVEGTPLVCGGFGQGRDGDLAVAQVVAGQGGQVVGDVAEAADGLFAGAGLAGGLGIGGCRPAGGGDGVGPVGRVLVGEGERCPGLAQVPDQVAGEHADQHVGANAVLQPVPDGPHVQVVGFDVPEVAFKERALVHT